MNEKGAKNGYVLEIWTGVYYSVSQYWVLLFIFAIDNDRSLNEGQFLVEEFVGFFSLTTCEA